MTLPHCVRKNARRPEQLPETELRCAYCGTPARDGWLGIEIWREDGGSCKDLRIDVQDLGFCTEEHSGRYFLDGRLPPTDFSEPETLPRTWRDRLFDASLPLILLPALLLILLGSLTLARWILH